MKDKAAWLGVAVMIAVIGLALAGCATGPYSSPTASKSQADLLREAGFKLHTPDTAQKQAYMETLPTQKMVCNRYQGQTCYLICTDPGSKQCYVGDQAAYQRYQQMAIQQNMSEDMHKVWEDRSDPEALQMWMNSQGGG
jgi:hypothetical protein